MKRARYDGPYEEVAVFDPEAEDGVYAGPVAIVKKGHLLPDDVPARIRDEFLKAANPFWSEVNQADQSKKDDDGDKAAAKADAKDEPRDTQSTKKDDA